NVDDLNILASRWQQALSVPTSSPVAPVRSPVRQPATRVADEVIGTAASPTSLGGAIDDAVTPSPFTT
ncbi:MAG TPA: hypothetical protein VH518_03950, partial [Tepidisphaeraceae bacterium]